MRAVGTWIALAALLAVCVHGAPRRECEVPPGRVAAPDHVLNVHVMAHTHDDTGWLETVDWYYEHVVQHVLNTVIDTLKYDPSKRFTFVEMAFFAKWWEKADNNSRILTKLLVEEGRLDFTIGGWCMPDEASPTYTDLIDQMTAGHQFIRETFGDVARPVVGWQIDPFGHSVANTYLYKQSGLEANLFFRIDHQDKTWRRKNQEMEFIWRPFRSFDHKPESQDVFSHVLWDTYCWPPGRSIINGKISWDANALANWLYNVALAYKTPEIIAPMGCDFEWGNAGVEYAGMDGLIAWYRNHPEYKINMFYSTPTQYYKTLQKYNMSLSVKKTDFFPYAMDPNKYWTGYFSSRPTFKRLIRVGSSLFHGARAFHTLITNDKAGSDAMKSLWHAVAVTQHHDAITGTSNNHVHEDYTRMLREGIESTKAAAAKVMRKLGGDESWQTCPPAEEDEVLCSRLPPESTIALFNPLAFARSEPVTIQVSTLAVDVLDAASNVIPCQRHDNQGSLEVSFIANVPPLGVSTYRLSGSRSSVAESVGADTTISNEFYELSFSGDGKVFSVLDKQRKIVIPLKSVVEYYVPDGSPSAPGAGAYVFISSGQSRAFPGPISMVKSSGSVFQQILVTIDPQSGISQRFRLYSGERAIRLRTQAGPIFVGDNYGKEVVIRLDSGVQSGDLIFTDSAGLEFVSHQRDFLDGRFPLENKVSGNFYPISLAGYIKDENTTFGMTTDRGQAMASLKPGSLEVLVHRRLLTASDVAPLTPMNDANVVRTTHRMILTDPKTAIRQLRSQALLQEHPFLAFWAPGNVKVASLKPLLSPLPPNVHMTTLQSYGPDKPTLIRLSHMYAVGEDAALSTPVTVDLSKLFVNKKVVSIMETNLSTNQEKGKVSDVRITLSPMEIRTFWVTLA